MTMDAVDHKTQAIESRSIYGFATILLILLPVIGGVVLLIAAWIWSGSKTEASPQPP
jgi:hypothetical protein